MLMDGRSSPSTARGHNINISVGGQHHLIDVVCDITADISLPHILGDKLGVALHRIAKAASTAGLHHVCVSPIEADVEDLGVGEIHFPPAIPADADTVASSLAPSIQSPRLAVHAVDARRERKWRQGLNYHFSAQTTSRASGTATIFPDRVTLH